MINEGNGMNPQNPESQGTDSGQYVPQPQYAQGQYGQQPQYDPNQYAQQQPYGQQPQYDPNQYAQQQPYGQQPQYDPNQYGQPEPPMKKRGMPKAVVAAVAAVAVVAVGVFGFFSLNKGGGGFENNDPPGKIGGIARSANPEEYLHASFEKTTRNIEQAASGYPDFLRFSTGPVEHSLSVEILDIIDASEMSGTTADVVLRYDPDGAKALLDFGFGYNGLNLKNNQIFVSKDLVALSAPDLYTRHKYLTINPNTFASDWNNSQFGILSPLDPEQFGAFSQFSEILSAASGNSALTAAAERMVQELQDQAGSVTEKAEFRDEGTENITIAGKSVKAARMSYNMSSNEAKEYFLSMLPPVRAYMDEYMEYMIQIGEFAGGGYYNPYSEMAGEMDAGFAEMERLQFPDGIKMEYYINEDTGLVSRVSIQDMRIIHSDYPEEEISMSMEMDMLGDKSVMDDFALTMSIMDSYGEKTAIGLTKNTTHDTAVSDKGSLYVEVGGNKELDFEYIMSWDAAAAENNFGLSVKADFDYQSGEFSVRGNMTDSSDGVKIENGVLDIAMSGETMVSIGFDYGVRSISDKDVDIDRTQAVDFFTLDMDEFTQDIMAGAMKFSAFLAG